MALTQAELLQYLATHNIEYQLYEHEPLRTCEQAVVVVERMQIPGMGIKNLFLKDSKKRLYHIIASHTTRIDLKQTGKTLGAKELRFANSELLMTHLGVEPGAVTPLALINDAHNEVQAIIDHTLLDHTHIQAHPLKNDATVVIRLKDLQTFFETISKPYHIYNFADHSLQTP